MGVSLLNFFDLKPLNTSKRPLNVNHTFFRDTRYLFLTLPSLPDQDHQDPVLPRSQQAEQVHPREGHQSGPVGPVGVLPSPRTPSLTYIQFLIKGSLQKRERSVKFFTLWVLTN